MTRRELPETLKEQYPDTPKWFLHYSEDYGRHRVAMANNVKNVKLGTPLSTLENVKIGTEKIFDIYECQPRLVISAPKRTLVPVLGI